MSKVLFPSLRIGYVVLPAPLVDGFVALRGVLDDHGPLIDQAALAEFIAARAFYRHIRRCRGEYGARLQTFVESAAKLRLPLSFTHTDGGMNLAGFLDDGANDEHYSAYLHEQGVEVPALSLYSIRPTRVGLLFGFIAFSQNSIRDGMKRAAEAVHSVAR